MEELIEKVENLKDVLNHIDQVEEYKMRKQEILKDKDLLDRIELYNKTNQKSLKEEIIKNQAFRDYKKLETDINFLILEINQQLKTIQKKDWCKK